MTVTKEADSSAAATKQRTIFGDDIKAPAKSIPPRQIKPKREFSAATLALRLRWFDMVLLVLVLILAFFLGSFVAHNTDLYLHLGLGNPFGGPADSSDWVHHAWLSTMFLRMFYDPYSAAGLSDGHWAIVAKALVIVALALVLCLTRRRGQSLVLPIACTALALIVISPRLTLQPMVLSFLFLAVMLYILTLPTSQHPRAIWCLPLLFVLWVNMDQWFILGPVTVALWLLGECLSRRHKGEWVTKGARRLQLASVLGVGLACCFLNPWFHQAFQLPVELAYPLANILPESVVGAGQTVARIRLNDPQFMLVISPFSSAYVSSPNPNVGRHFAGWAYFALLFLGIISFAIRGFSRKETVHAAKETGLIVDGYKENSECSSNPLLFIFVFFAMLSIYHYRLIALFAVVTGPIIALNLQDWLSRNRNTAVGMNRIEFNWAVLGRGAVLLAFLLMLACAWPGWLYAYVQDWRGTRHVNWLVANDPDVPEAARVIGEIQRKTGLCKLGFNYSLEGGNLFTWSSVQANPEVRLMCDGRLSLYRDRGEAFGKIRKALREEAEQFFGVVPRDRVERQKRLNEIRHVGEGYREPMRSMGVDYVVFTRLHHEPQQLQKIVDCMLIDAFRQWVLLYHDGRTVIFGWIDPEAPRRTEVYREYQLDFNRLVPSQTMPPNVPWVTLGMSRVPPVTEEASNEWYQYLYGPTQPALSSFQSARYVGYFELEQNDWERRSVDFLCAVTGIAVIPSSDVPTKGPIRLRKDAKGQSITDRLFLPNDVGPPAALVLAVRAARKATIENANDSTAHMNFVQALQMLQVRQEDFWCDRRPIEYQPYKPGLRHQLRRMQIITALHNALAVQPENPLLHLAMHDWYMEINYFDVAADHLIQAKKVQDRRASGSKEQSDAAVQLTQHVKTVTEELKRRYDGYVLAISDRTDVLEKFENALVDRSQKATESGPARRGLISLGHQLLRHTRPEDLKGNSAKMQVILSWDAYLMLTTGQAREASQLLFDKSLQSQLRGEEFDLLRGLAAAALGDYVTADKQLEDVEKALKLPSDEQIQEQQREPARKLARHLTSIIGWMPMADGYPAYLSRMGAFSVGQVNIMIEFTQSIKERHQAAELRLLRGLLALETGDTSAAAKHFQGCLNIIPIGLDFPDRRIAQRYLEILQSK